MWIELSGRGLNPNHPNEKSLNIMCDNYKWLDISSIPCSVEASPQGVLGLLQPSGILGRSSESAFGGIHTFADIVREWSSRREGAPNVSALRLCMGSWCCSELKLSPRGLIIGEMSSRKDLNSLIYFRRCLRITNNKPPSFWRRMQRDHVHFSWMLGKPRDDRRSSGKTLSTRRQRCRSWSWSYSTRRRHHYCLSGGRRNRKGGGSIHFLNCHGDRLWRSCLG